MKSPIALAIQLDGDVKTSEPAQPVPLSRLACEVLRKWRKEQGSRSPYIFPSPRDASKPIRSIKRAWRTALTKADVPYSPIYSLRHVFCTRLSWVEPDAIVQRAMRHSHCDDIAKASANCLGWGLIQQLRASLVKHFLLLNLDCFGICDDGSRQPDVVSLLPEGRSLRTVGIRTCQGQRNRGRLLGVNEHFPITGATTLPRP
jgi:hypothetical protein